MAGKLSAKRNLLNEIFGIVGPMNAVRQLEWRAIIRQLDPEAGDLVLDAACGIGLLAMRLARRGLVVLGVDVSRRAVEIAGSILKDRGLACSFSLQDAERLACSEGVFDAVVSSSALEHFHNDEAALREILRVLKPGGTLVLTCDSLSARIGDRLRETHRQRAKVVNYYSLEEITAKAQRLGFRIEHSGYLVTSRLSTVIYRIGIVLGWTGLVWAILSLLAYPLCALSDQVTGQYRQGQTVIIRARKPDSRWNGTDRLGN